MPENDRRQPEGQEHLEFVPGPRHRAQREKTIEAVQENQNHRAQETAFLREHRKDKIGVLLGNEVELRLRAFQKSLAENLSGTYRDPALKGVIAFVFGVAFRIDEG